MVVVNLAFVAAGGNRHPSAADWDETNSILAFGAGRNIALWKPLESSARGIYALLPGHTETINAVKFFASSAATRPFLLSGSVDGTICVWSWKEGSAFGYEVTKILQEHEKAITTFAVLPGADLFVSGASDGDFRVWRIESAEIGTDLKISCVQQHTLAPRLFPLAIALASLPNSDSLVLAVAGSKSFIQIFVSEDSRFHLAATLTGHEGWIRSLDFVKENDDPDSDLLLASASQDKYIRLWRLHQGEELPALNEAAKDPLLGSVGRSLSNKAHRFESGDNKYSLTFEALLLGHEDWIFTARWKRISGQAKLLSASADNSLAIWEADSSSGVWLSTVRLGEISAQKGATTATGSTGGFWIGLWGPNGDTVVSLGRTGSWRLWSYDASEDSWNQGIAVGGHTREVKGITWTKDGSCLLSTSSDQTTRLYAEWKAKRESSSWHEFSRPQIHGYDLNCIDSIGDTQFISGADEKLLRVFNEPRGVAELLTELCNIDNKSKDVLPEVASIPVLGLSNKVLDAAEDQNQDDEADETPETISTAISEKHMPPTEDHLARHLLWPETEKLYGHGYEISAVAASNDGTLVATACRASSIDHAVIRLYETSTWREVKPPLTAHSLTVTALEFSPDDKYLLSVGRDRQCAVYGRNQTRATEYSMLATNPKAHSRMLLDASWAPTEAKDVFATAGRDKNVHVWRLQSEELQRLSTIAAQLPVTATAILQTSVASSLILAYGLEDGSIHVARLSVDDLQLVDEQFTVPSAMAPSMPITQLAWRPSQTQNMADGNSMHHGNMEKTHQLASASEDCSLRIYDIKLS